jgi:hypothetical protein
MKKPVALIFVLLAASYIYAQTATDLQSQYGNPVAVYSVSEHIWMTPEYDSDVQVCRMRLYPKRISADTNYLGHDLPFNELRDVLNALVQVETRGAKREFFGTTATGGGSAWTTYGYENVSFTFMSFSPIASFDGTVLKKGEYTFPALDTFPALETEPLPKESSPSSNDFVQWTSPRTEIVVVSWNGRKCTGQ